MSAHADDATSARQRTDRLVELGQLIANHLDDRPALPGVTLFSTDAVDEPTATIADAAFAFVAQGAKRIAVGSQVFDYGPGDYLVVSVDLPVTGQFTSASRALPFLGIGLTLDPGAIAALLLEVGEADPAAPGRFRPRTALGTSRAGPELLDALVRLVRLLETPRDLDVLAPLIHREILWRLLNGGHGDLLRQIGLSSSTMAHIGDAVRWIRANSAEPFRVEDLARRAAMSVSTFHRQFRTATTMGPIQFQKKVRLQRARLLLTGSDLDVTRVATDVGYESASQFSREYAREWGIAPSRERCQAQGAG